MADQLNMGGLSLGPGAAEQQPAARSYIPPHMRGKMGAGGHGGPPPINIAGGPPPMNGPGGPPPMNGPGGPPPMNGPGPSPAAMNGLNSSAWAGYVHVFSFPAAMVTVFTSWKTSARALAPNLVLPLPSSRKPLFLSRINS